MALLVVKYGGSSLATPARITEAARRIGRYKDAGHRLVVVVSAMGDTTDDLLREAFRVSQNPPIRELDMLLTAGERISMALMAIALHALGHEAISFTGSQSGIITDTLHGSARIIDVRAVRIQEELDRGRVVIVAGFQGVSSRREITTLGRGGSDTTAVALAASFRADRCEIFTDVAGVYTADPRVVPGARAIDELSYGEMSEMASLGAGVVHARSNEIARTYHVPVRVASTFLEGGGTVISDRMTEVSVRAVAHQRGLARVAWEGLPGLERAAELVEAIAARGVPLRMAVQRLCADGSVDVTVVCDRQALGKVLGAGEGLEGLREAGCRVESRDGLGSVSVVGQGVSNQPETVPRALRVLAACGVVVELVQTTPLALTGLIGEDKVEEAVRALHREFLEEPAQA